MADTQQYSDSSENYYTDINVKIRDIEEKQNIIKDRVILIGENLITSKEELDTSIEEIKKELNKVDQDLKKLKMAMERMIDDSNNFVRKNEFEILQRQFKMFEPLELARMSDVEYLIKKALSEKK